MTINMSKAFLAAVAATLVTLGAAAKADDYTGTTANDASAAALDHRAASSEFSDPTARDSMRSHGRP